MKAFIRLFKKLSVGYRRLILVINITTSALLPFLDEELHGEEFLFFYVVMFGIIFISLWLLTWVILWIKEGFEKE